MSEPNSDTYFGSPLDCPLSPFDHQASFVHFPSDNPLETTLAAMPDVAMTWTTTESYWVTKDGIKDLARSMGYRTKSMSKREEELIQADALTCIEKLRQDCPLTRRPRDLHPFMVRALLQLIVPENYIRSRQRFQSPRKDGIWTCEIDDLSSAAAIYIRFLQRTKETEQDRNVELEQEPKATAPEVRIEQPKKDEENMVERTLRKIESWCDDWLDGRLAEEEWDQMDKYL